MDKCLAVNSVKGSPDIKVLLTMPYDEALKFKHQWIFDKQKIAHFQTGFRLSLGYINDIWVDVVKNNTKDDRIQDWFFEPILIEGDSKCSDY